MRVNRRMFSLFENALDAHTHTPRQIILALSGGLDSRVMLRLLGRYRDIHPQHSYLIVHVHHGLSPNADAWMTQCQSWSRALGFAFEGLFVRIEKKGESLEKQARDARYRAIESVMQAGALVLTAQHADDQVESFLLALKRGSGPAGLAAMPETRLFGEGVLFRPFLQVSRDEIAKYAAQEGLVWLEDESNLDCRFDRNFIRHAWLPLAQERWKGLNKAIHRAAALCAEQENLLDELLMEHDKKVLSKEGTLLIGVLKKHSLRLQSALLRRWFKKRTHMALSYAQLQQVFHCVMGASEDANPKIKIGEWQIRRHQEGLYILPFFSDVALWESELKTQVELILPDDIGHLYLTLDSAEQGLKLREPDENEAVSVHFDPQGLWAHPLGRQGKRKLKKLFQEYGVPTWARKRTPLIFYGKHLACVADLFVCEGFEGKMLTLLWKKDADETR